MNDMRTPLGRVRGLGSAKDGHFAFLAAAGHRRGQCAADPFFVVLVVIAFRASPTRWFPQLWPIRWWRS
jgi:hypothetical protein